METKENKTDIVHRLINEMLVDKLKNLEDRNKTELEIIKKCKENRDTIVALINQSKIIFLKIEEAIRLKKEQKEKALLKRNASSNKFLSNSKSTAVIPNSRSRTINTKRNDGGLKTIKENPVISKFDYRSKSKAKLSEKNVNPNTSHFSLLNNTTINTTHTVNKSVGKILINSNTSTNLKMNRTIDHETPYVGRLNAIKNMKGNNNNVSIGRYNKNVPLNKSMNKTKDNSKDNSNNTSLLNKTTNNISTSKRLPTRDRNKSDYQSSLQDRLSKPKQKESKVFFIDR